MDWIDVTEDLPLRDYHYNTLSVEVMCLLPGGDTVRGFYREDDNSWFIFKPGGKIRRTDVVAWCDL